MWRLGLAAAVVAALAACGGAEGPATPSPIDTYVEWTDSTNDVIYIEVTSTAALHDFMRTSGSITATQLEALPAGAEIACHKQATVDNSRTTIWDDGTPGGKTLAQEACNR